MNVKAYAIYQGVAGLGFKVGLSWNITIAADFKVGGDEVLC